MIRYNFTNVSREALVKIVQKPNRKGGHRHHRNYCICNVCGHWFRKNKGIHEEGFDFCGGKCDSQAIWEASLEADVGGGFEPHFWEE